MSIVSPGGFPLEAIGGNSGSMASWVGVFDDVADGLEDVQTQADLAAELPGVGTSIRAARADATELSAVLTPDIAEAQLLSRVLSDYADVYDASAVPANRMIDEIEQAHSAWQRAEADAQSAALAALWASRGGPEEDAAEANDDARAAVADRDTAKAALDELWQTWETLVRQWDEGYDAALSSLANGRPVALTTEQRELLDALLGANSAEEVSELWQNADPEVRKALADRHPEIIGNLDGVPYDVRAAVNRARLDELLAVEPPGDRREELESILRALEADGPSSPNLISFDPDGSAQTTAAIAYGDLTNATEINSLIPGMNGNVHDLQAWGESAKALNRSVGAGSATVVWFGYDTPELLEEPAMGRAKAGAAALASFLSGLGALSPQADINVVAHSYGSTTAALAIGSRPDGLGVTSFIAVGSAGFPNDPAVVENLTNGQPPQIYATISEDDGVARIGRATAPNHSTVPETLPGTTVFDSDGGVDAAGKTLPAATGHDALGPGAYLQPGSESFYNVSEIIQTGEPGTERGGQGSTAGWWDASNWWISDEYDLIDF